MNRDGLRWWMVAAALAATGCGSTVVIPAPAADVPSARACQSTADCVRGEECHIVEGCATPSYCGPLLGRPCTGDLAPYCGCDGRTFFASSSCPSRTFARRGACEGIDAGAPCALGDGRFCPQGQRCPAPDGCNTCTCGPQGLACTEIACLDAGPAPTDRGPACRFMDARGEGDCDGYFGVTWNGTACVGVTGCRCVGADCGRLYADRPSCLAACGG